MACLDVSPMIGALRRTPDEFELAGEWLTHVHSGHRFRFGANDQVEIHADCNCALLALTPEQERELAGTFREWEREHWRPLQINREFAAHFAHKPGLRWALIVLTGKLHRWLLRPPRAASGPVAVARTS